MHSREKCTVSQHIHSSGHDTTIGTPYWRRVIGSPWQPGGEGNDHLQLNVSIFFLSHMRLDVLSLSSNPHVCSVASPHPHMTPVGWLQLARYRLLPPKGQIIPLIAMNYLQAHLLQYFFSIDSSIFQSLTLPFLYASCLVIKSVFVQRVSCAWAVRGSKQHSVTPGGGHCFLSIF